MVIGLPVGASAAGAPPSADAAAANGAFQLAA